MIMIVIQAEEYLAPITIDFKQGEYVYAWMLSSSYFFIII